ncbi:odorant receptor [Culex quinquefasciatus]|uniref:Odorant receptor n=1 Tax=Culex quinquefasciatus TaxID=7176 RepID=B0WL44_CULQU|nr:odorant receptor [Culex quinquefasciatus]|eukprot:XP_001849428.1 odorant receptor [Culex quinquefasciatus]
MDPIQEFEQICGWQCRVLKQFGICAYEQSFKPSARTVLLLLLISCYFFIAFYDLHHFLGDLFSFAFALVTLAYGLIGISRVGHLLANPARFSELMHEAKKTYERSALNQREAKILKRYTSWLKHCVIFYSMAFVAATVATGLLPTVIYLWTGQRNLPLGIELPFLDPDSLKGYLLNYLYQISCMLWTPPALIAVQNMCFILVFNVFIQYDILLLGLEDLNLLIKENTDGKLDSDVHQKLLQVLQYHQRLTSFSGAIERSFSVQFFVEISSNALQVIVTLFVANTANWMPGYLIIFLATFQSLMLCFLGALNELKSDQLVAKIYDVAWSEMRLPEQKSIHILLTKSQQASLLSCGGLLPMNMNLFLKVGFFSEAIKVSVPTRVEIYPK